MTSAFDKMADKLESENPSAALVVDRLSDWIERRAFNPAGWLPSRGSRAPSYPSYRRPSQNGHNGNYHSLVCQECGYTKTASLSFGRCPQCGGQMGLDVRSLRFASSLMKSVMQAKKTKMPVVFLGGECDENNQWRKDIKKEYGKDLFFLDPYDENWEAEDNIYDELAGMMVADHVVFYKGGKGSGREKKFLDTIPDEKSYSEFDSLEGLHAHLDKLKSPL